MRSKPTDSKGTATRKYEQWNARCLDTYLLEIIAAIFSTACFIAICAILIAYEGKTRPEMPYGLSLNAIISVLATGCKSSLLFMVGEALSQAKWIWFHGTTRPLLDMQTFDGASRGPLGAMMMIFQRKRSLATFGAAIVVLLLAFDPFVQQIIKYPTRSAPMDGTNLAKTKKLKSFLPYGTQAQWNMAYLSALWSEENLYHPQCFSGNCTWPVFRSTGVCSKCADTTTSVGFDCHKTPYQNDTFDEKLSREEQYSHFNESCHITPRLGQSTVANASFVIPYANNSGGNPTVEFQQNMTWSVYTGFDGDASVSTIQNVDNSTFAGITNPLMVLADAKIRYDMDFINSSEPAKGLSLERVTECSLALFLSDWKTSVSNGTTTFETSNIDYGQLEWTNVTSSEPFRSLCWKPTYSPSNTSFYAAYLGESGWEMTTSPVEFAFCNIELVRLIQWPFVGSSGMFYTWKNGSLEKNDFYPGRNDPSSERISIAGLEHIMSNVANSLNKLALSASDKWWWIEDVNGTAYDIEVYVVVQWPWLILPGLLVISGISFLALIMLSYKNTDLWESSVLAFLYHGLDNVDDIHKCASASGMEMDAANMNIQLRDSREKGSLKLETDERTEEEP